MGILNIDKLCQKQDKHIQLPTTALFLTIMKGFLFFTSSIAFVLGAPQFLSEQSQSKNENCHTEVVTIFEESEAESVNKVICETEFRDSCVKKLENICNNVATGELECELVDRFNCVDSMTNKCGLESVLKNVSYTETVCDTVMEDICELEVRNGIKEPVEGSCLAKPVEKCGPVTRFTEEFVEEEVCRDIPIKDCENVQEEVCNEKKEEVCEELETESCEVVPHEECKQVVEKVPQKVSKKVTKVVCEDKESMNMKLSQRFQILMISWKYLELQVETMKLIAMMSKLQKLHLQQPQHQPQLQHFQLLLHLQLHQQQLHQPQHHQQQPQPQHHQQLQNHQQLMNLEVSQQRKQAEWMCQK